jgi:membrane-associated phospholipid phosphatase
LTTGVLPPPVATTNAAVPPGRGFPSGHIAATTAFMLGLLILGGWRGAGLAALIVVPLMAASRLYLGRHFPADLLGGVAIAVVATAAVARLRL